MKQGLFTIRENRKRAKNVFSMVLEGDTTGIQRPGQFLNVALEGFYLRRPFSVCDWDAGSLTILYKLVGAGTRHMASLEKGHVLDILTGLGNGYDMDPAGSSPLLVGGGAGIPPLYGLAKRLARPGVCPHVVLGFRTKDEAFYVEAFQNLGCRVTVSTQDGSMGIPGLVTEGMEGERPSYLYACGPEGMLRAVYEKVSCDGQFSFEERMACGFGACMGCSCQTKYGSKRICKEGPVLRRGEILW